MIEILKDVNISVHKLHLSTSNQEASVLKDILKIVKNRGIEIAYHDKKSLSRISKNSKQDQGVALDIIMPNFITLDTFVSTNSGYRIVALDGVTNPQNLGMIARSCAAGNIDALLIQSKMNAQISPLAIKASAGTLFKIPIIKSNNLVQTLKELKDLGADVYTLASDATNKYMDETYSHKSIFVLGNESVGVSNEIRLLSDKNISIPMKRGVESLNVAITAALLAFMV